MENRAKSERHERFVIAACAGLPTAGSRVRGLGHSLTLLSLRRTARRRFATYRHSVLRKSLALADIALADRWGDCYAGECAIDWRELRLRRTW